MSSQNVDDNEALNFNDTNIKNSKEVESLGIKMERNLCFNIHTKRVCSKTGQMLRRSSENIFQTQF